MKNNENCRLFIRIMAAMLLVCAFACISVPAAAEQAAADQAAAEQTAAEQGIASESRYPGMPHMSYEEYPAVDGSLACVPLMEKLIMEVTGCSEAEAEASLDDFSNTNPSYYALLHGETDLILAYEASSDTKNYLQEKLQEKEEKEKAAQNLTENMSGDEYPDQPEEIETEEEPYQKYREEEKPVYEIDLQPVGQDALVFIVNADNPVESLTSQQIHDIYTGKITNWSEIGGEDIEVRPFQRRENSGSQTLMRLLLMGEEKIPEKQVISVAEMEGLINTVMEYDNSANAIGYSVYYYASVMMGNDRLKFLAVDGVSPSNETIRSGEYKLANPFYCGVSSASSDTAIQLRDWLLSEEGQQFVEDCGYVAAGEDQESKE